MNKDEIIEKLKAAIGKLPEEKRVETLDHVIAQLEKAHIETLPGPKQAEVLSLLMLHIEIVGAGSVEELEAIMDKYGFQKAKSHE